MQLKEILSRLKVVKGGGTQYTALCPAHEDKTPSLAISEKDGKILLHCYAGCSTENIVAAIGLEMRDLFAAENTPQGGHAADNNTNPSAASKSKREITAVYDYKDMDGNTVHSTIRYAPKGFSQRRPDLDKPGGYIYKDVFKGVTPTLYNLQAVANAIKERQPVLIVEGEKDCENLVKLGFIATTCPMGAGKWRKEYSDMLMGATVYIIADNDEVGANHAKIVAKSLIGKAGTIHLIDLTIGIPELTIPELPVGGDISDVLSTLPSERHTKAIEAYMGAAQLYIPEKEPPQEENDETLPSGKKSPAELLLNLVEATNTGFFHSDIKELYATIPVDGHTEIKHLNSRDFELWLNRLYYMEHSKPISKDAIKQVLAVLSAKALYDNPTPVKLSTRVAGHDSAFWYDLSNPSWQAVKITSDSWEIVDNPPLMFERHNHQSPQVMPRHSGNVRKILQYVNIKENKTLFLCDLISKFIPYIPHPMPDFHGEKGAAKSTVSVMLKLLIDPSKLKTLALPKDERDFVVVFREHWFTPFDNIGFISADISNMLCRVIMGDGVQQRRLHTNSDSVIFDLQRCIAVNGIDIVPTKSDLLDRTILFELMRIEDNDRRELSEVMASFEADRADILGGVFDTLSKAMAIYPIVKLQGLKRMADFTRWGYAIGEALGGLGEEFLQEYQHNYERQNDEVLNSDPVATLTIEFMRDKDDWYGTHSQLRDKFVELSDSCAINAKHKNFPKDAAALGRRLRSIMSNLRHEGIWYMPEKRKNYGVPLTLKKRNQPTPPTPSYTNDEKVSNSHTSECVGHSVGSSVGTVMSAMPTPYHTPEPTRHKTAQNQGLSGKSVGVYDGVGEKAPFGDGWFETTDEEIPPEFLNPTLPTAPMPQQEQLRLPQSQ